VQTDPELHEQMARLDSCAMSDALDRWGLPGAAAGIGPVAAARPIAGRAITVRLRTAGPVAPARHLCTAAIEAAGPGTVIVVQHPGGRAAGWGGILSLAATVRGIEGVVVDGPVRDVDEAASLGFPVFARSVTPVTARGRIAEADWNVPVAIDGCTVTPGDLVLADRSGVVFVPAARAAEIIAVAAQIAAREADMAAAVRGGAAVSQVMNSTYERLLGQATEASSA
jgi:regulator of RNase E activity RraA